MYSKTYAEYLYDLAMNLWYGSPTTTTLVDTSVVVTIYERSWKAARHEGVRHPEELC